MKYIIHIGHRKSSIKLKPNQEITNIARHIVAIIWMLFGIIFMLHGKDIIVISRIIIDIGFFLVVMGIWVLLFVFVIKEYDTKITE